MKKIIYLFIILIFISCNSYRTTGKQLMKIKQGMHYNDVIDTLQTQLSIYDINSKYFKVRVTYRVDYQTIRYQYINFNRKDSLVVNMD